MFIKKIKRRQDIMKILLVNPQIPTTFWSFHNALKFISKKSSEPPLGLLTVAALLPDNWQKKLVDMNVESLEDRELLWADYVLLTGMHVQKKSFMEVVRRCHNLAIPVIAGGSMCTMEPGEFTEVDHLILNEAEITLPLFLADLQKGQAKKIYTSDQFPDLSETPAPMWQLLDMKKYASMSMQYSRGCPYNCDFCSITLLNGRKPRTKDKAQFLNEIESLYHTGWRGRVFIVDDNFIGNKKKLKVEILPALISWSEQRAYPFNFMTEVSINLADDDELLDLMVRAGFDAAFVGIETPNTDSLKECGKTHNQKKLQNKGLVVSGGFIVGFDHDPENIFDQQISFIQDSGIVTAMVGLLNAPPGTQLFKRLNSENRILREFTGDNMDGSINFIPKMNYQKLMDGYHEILAHIYSPEQYYKRIKKFLKEYRLPVKVNFSISLNQINALFKSFWVLGILEKGRLYYWKLLIYSLLRYPEKFAIAVTMAIYGVHFRRVIQLT
jgi:radical SAM superfamily enzyme YgiQ (UPF0313 family)